MHHSLSFDNQRDASGMSANINHNENLRTMPPIPCLCQFFALPLLRNLHRHSACRQSNKFVTKEFFSQNAIARAIIPSP